MAYVYLKKAAGGAILTTTNALGEFTLPGALAGTQVVVEFEGPYVEVCAFGAGGGSSCAGFMTPATLTPTFTPIVMNRSPGPNSRAAVSILMGPGWRKKGAHVRRAADGFALRVIEVNAP